MEQSIVCPNCGRRNPQGAQFCAGCGSNLPSAPPQSSYQQPQQTYGQPYQAGPGPQWQGAPMGSPKQQIINAIQMRTTTDDIVPTWWCVLPFLGIVLTIAFLVTYFVLGGWIWALLAGVGVVIYLVLFAYFVYKLVSRQNDHMKREMVLRTALVNYLREKAREQYKEQMVAPQLATMDSINQEAAYKESEHSPLLMTILSFVPILNYYVLYVLMDFIYEHDNRWHAFTQNAQAAGSQLGLNIMIPSWRTLPSRSFVIYLIITLIIGVFIFYWYYVLIKDPNDHFNTQWQFEDQLMGQLR